MMELCGIVSRESILTSWPVTLTGDSSRRAAAAKVQSVSCANGCENGMSKVREREGSKIKAPVQVFAAKVVTISVRLFDVWLRAHDGGLTVQLLHQYTIFNLWIWWSIPHINSTGFHFLCTPPISQVQRPCSQILQIPFRVSIQVAGHRVQWVKIREM